MKFSEIPGNKELKARLSQSIDSGRIPHAQFFSGKDGWGTFATAVAYAQYLLCENKINGDSCGTCSSCIKMNKLIHPDVHFFYPIYSTAKLESYSPTNDELLPKFREVFLRNPIISEDEWLQNPVFEGKVVRYYVGQAKDIIRKLAYSPFESSYKIIIMWMPEKMDVSASTRLLKIIEEPNPNTLFLFVSSKKDQVLSTIMSRVQIVPLGKVKDFEMTEYLHKIIPDAELTSVHQAVNMADGDINAAITILNNKDDGKFMIGKFREWLLDCMNYQMRQIISLGDEMSNTSKEKVKVFLCYGFHLIRESLVYKNESSVQRLSEIEKEFVWRFSKFITIENAQEFADIFQKAIYAIDRNANVKILWGTISLKIGDFLNKNIQR